MTPVPSLALKDRLEIRELEARYALATDTGDAIARANTFTPDGVLESGGIRYEGRAAIAMQTTELWARNEPNRYGARPGETQHWIHNLVIDGHGHRATAVAYVMLMLATDEGAKAVFIGQYLDTLEKVDGGWLFARKVSQTWPVPVNRPSTS